MNDVAIFAMLLSGLGLFFIGVRMLSANLVPLVGRRTRIVFAKALRGPVSCAVSGLAAGMATQSSSAVSWVVLGFVRAGILPAAGRAVVAPAWSNVGTAMLPLLLAIDTSVAASFVIGLVGITTYFKLARTDRLRNILEAALGAALLLFGMHGVSIAVAPVREELTAGGALAFALQSPWALVFIGAGFSFLAQSSSVATAIAVAAVRAGLLTVPGALPLIAGANAAAIGNNLLMLSGENVSGRLVFMLQVVQKTAGSLLLAVVAVMAVGNPESITSFATHIAHTASGQIAVIFTIAQILGAIVASLTIQPVEALVRRLTPPSPAETLARPAFLLREALSDPLAALDLIIRELARLSSRLPLLLDHVRAEPDATTPPTATLRAAGVALAGTVKSYITSLLDSQLRRSEVAAALLLEDAAGNAVSLHEAIAELTAAAPQAAALPTANSLIEGLHAVLTTVADYMEDPTTDGLEMVLDLLGDRDQLMEDLRLRLSSGSTAATEIQDALFRMTILFERVVWLARRLVIDMNQAHRTLAAD